MASSADDSIPGFDDEDEEDTYRLLPPEPATHEERRPDSSSDTIGSFDETETTLGRPAGQRKRRKTRRKPGAKGEAAAEMPASTGSFPDEDEEEKWIADSGWREPPLISAAVYPFTGSGVKLLIAYSFVLWLAGVVPVVGPVFGIAGMTFIAVMLLETATFTLEEVPSGPQIPEWFNWGTIRVGLMGLVAFMTAGVPLIVGVAVMVRTGTWSTATDEKWRAATQLALVAVGFFYVPMAFLALAEQQSERALNPMRVFRGMKKMLAAYLLLCTIAAVVYLAPLCLLILLGAHSLTLWFASNFLLVYVAAALIRAVALVARKKTLTFDS